MIMKMRIFLMAMAVVTALSLTSCDNEEDTRELEPIVVSEGVFVVNGGNQSGGIDGSLTYYDYVAGKASQSVYQAANGVSLGITVNDAAVNGSRIYIVGCGESTIFVADRKTLKKVGNIKAEVDGRAVMPRRIVAAGQYMLVSTYGNAVLAVDTLTNSIAKVFGCGSYTEGMAIYKGMIYTADSDYGKGQNPSVSKIDMNTGTTDTFKHELLKDPVDVKVVNGRLFVLDSGSYDANWNQTGQGVFELAGGQVRKIMEATEMTVCNGKIYTINAPYTSDGTVPTYEVYDVAADRVETFCDGTEIAYPAKISADPVRECVYITSYSLKAGSQYADYRSPGYCAMYDTAGKYIGRFECGVGCGYVVPNAGVEYK